MSISYNGSHSISFYIAQDSETDSTPVFYEHKINTWTDLKLVPLTRPSISPLKPIIKIIEIPGTSNRLDLTDLSPGGLRYEIISGSWNFAIDHDQYLNWHIAKKSIEETINGNRFYCVLDDDDSIAYRGRFAVGEWQSGDVCSSVSINYNLEPILYKNAFNIPADIQGSKIISSWVDVDNSIRNGSYLTKYNIGDLCYLHIQGEYDGYAEIVGIDADSDSNNNLIPITWVLKNLLNAYKKMNNSASNYRGWPSCAMRGYVDGLKDCFPSRLKSMLKICKKTSREGYTGTLPRDLVSYDTLWIPSAREVGFTGIETSGPIYDSYFTDSSSRRKNRIGTSTTVGWWLRSAYTEDANSFRNVSNGGTMIDGTADTSFGVLLGFCTGASV